jgi:hypothetical protein
VTVAIRFDRYGRIEPRQPYEDLGAGFRAEIHDPVWFLGRQWQLGEHQGEDASSPVQVRFRARHRALEAVGGDAAYNPTTTPPEAIIESEPGDWWTPGRRVRLGILAADAAGLPNPSDPAADPTLLLTDLPAPFHHLHRLGYDGLTLYRRRAQLGLDGDAVFADVPPPATDLWDPAELAYAADFAVDGAVLRAPRHHGGRVDWYSVDASGPVSTAGAATPPVEVVASRLRYPGAPHPRWWQIEDAHVDIGGFPPDRSHFPTLLLIDLVVAHSDDWYTFPIPARSGSVVVLEEVTVRDSFGDEWALTPPAGWTLFHVAGLQAGALVVWPTVTTPLTGDSLEDVILGIDEDANLLFAVERRLDGRDVATPSSTDDAAGGPPADTSGEIDVSARARYRYSASAKVPRRWHPYVVGEVDGRRRLVQARLADLTTDPPVLAPEPSARVLVDPTAGAGDPAHQIEPATIPSQGVRLERRWMLARRTDATPILWIQRRRLPLLAPPGIDLGFDELERVPTVIHP